MNKSFEVRLHGRGGQGGVTCAKILASVYSRMGCSVQTFGDYAGERSGAPVRAYARISDGPITNRNKVYTPDEILVLDDSLLGADTLQGLALGGGLLINSPVSLEDFEAEGDERYRAFRLGLVDATAIARRHGIGTRTVVIVNTTIAGAFARMQGIDLEQLEATFQDLGLSSNLPAAVEAYEAVRLRAAPAVSTDSRQPLGWGPPTVGQPPVLIPDGELPTVGSLTEHVSSSPTGLATGSWSSQRPSYVEKLAPCTAFCPAGNDVVGFLQALADPARGELPHSPAALASAAAILERSTPFAGTCGRVCPAPCMEGCNRVELDGSVDIRGLERWIADHHAFAPVLPEAHNGPDPEPGLEDAAALPEAGLENGTRNGVETNGASGEPLGVVARVPAPARIAIVGGGPAGLAAAFETAKAGHAATIFEGEASLGGVLRTGIPNYRLPREVLDLEVEGVLALGVESRCGEFLDRNRVAELEAEYDALILATGLQRLRGLDVPGAELGGIEQGIDFLKRVNAAPTKASISGHVVVLGGGNTAMDCARSALRAGAARVTVAYRRSLDEMPAIREEIHEADREGVGLVVLRAPVGFQGDDGQVKAVELAVVELGEPDESGRRRPEITDETELLACDQVLLALGQSADRRLLPDDWVLVWDDPNVERGSVQRIDDQGMHPLLVFGAGDLATGEGTVAHAIGSGRRAAGLALDALGRLTGGQQPFERPDRRNAVSAVNMNLDHFPRRAPARQSTLDKSQALMGFAEVNHGLADDTEAGRCFSCGHCTRCDTCLVYCPEGIIRRRDESGQAYDVDTTYCKGCGICATECPRDAIEMQTQ